MKIHQILSIAGGIALIGSTFLPAHGTNMWGALEVIDRYFMIGALPIIICFSGLLGALLGAGGNGLITLICGALALLWMLFAIKFQLVVIAMEPLFLLSLVGAVLMTAAGIIGLNKRND